VRHTDFFAVVASLSGIVRGRLLARVGKREAFRQNLTEKVDFSRRNVVAAAYNDWR
jgi:hypothetical protein